jgi:2-keto-4-pentenoate hydratase/2-oxohepta-3-ene-1,7-dioic acid hydratase in catechol pathway
MSSSSASSSARAARTSPGQGARHIFGYLIFNDVSARDIQMREMQGQLGPTKGKDFDTGNIMGPWLVTADEVADPVQSDHGGARSTARNGRAAIPAPCTTSSRT